MIPDSRDRLGDTLREKGKGTEDQYFAKQDRELLAKLKKTRSASEEEAIRAAARMRCPKCGDLLKQRTWDEISVDDCPSCGGMWLDKGEFEDLAKREHEGWLGRLLRSR